MKSPSTESPRHIVNDGEELTECRSEELDVKGEVSISIDAPGLKVVSRDGVKVSDDVEFDCDSEDQLFPPSTVIGAADKFSNDSDTADWVPAILDRLSRASSEQPRVIVADTLSGIVPDHGHLRTPEALGRPKGMGPPPEGVAPNTVLEDMFLCSPSVRSSRLSHVWFLRIMNLDTAFRECLCSSRCVALLRYFPLGDDVLLCGLKTSLKLLMSFTGLKSGASSVLH